MSKLSANVSSTPKKSIINDALTALSPEVPKRLDFRNDAAWSSFSTLGAGTAEFSLVRVSADDSFAWIPALRKAGILLVPLGGGSNFAGWDDARENVLFLKCADKEVRFHTDCVEADAGCVLSVFMCQVFENGFSGTASLSGIPGTVGGAIFMNAGAKGACISDFLLSFEAVNLLNGEKRTFRKSELPWEYRNSGIGSEWMVLRAKFRFPACANRDEEVQARETERIRRANAPKGRSAGSIFKNPGGGLPPAGKLLEDAGVKGRREGAFSVSEKHANWIINDDSVPAKEKDFICLVNRMQKAVFDRTSIILHTEVRFADMDSERKVGMGVNTKVLVVMGGESSEREISLKSGRNVVNALKEAGYNVREYDIRKLGLTPDMLIWANVVFPVLHGGYGEDGRFQALLERAGLRFVGPGSVACKNIMDKLLSKKLMQAAGVATPAWAIIENAKAQLPEGFRLPVIVKPNSNGSTFGVTLVETADEWTAALEDAFRYDSSVFVEEYIKGKEGSISIVNGEPLPIMEIQFPGKIYDYDAKYNANSKARHICPPETMTEAEQEAVRKTALAYAKAVGAEQLVRVDVIIRATDGKVFVLEGNGLPGMTDTNMLPSEARAAGIPMPELCANLVQSAYTRQ